MAATTRSRLKGSVRDILDCPREPAKSDHLVAIIALWTSSVAFPFVRCRPVAARDERDHDSRVAKTPELASSTTWLC